MDALHDVRRVVHDLLRDAADVDAGAAQRALLADGYFGTMRGRAARARDAAAAGADHEVVEVPALRSLSRRLRSCVARTPSEVEDAVVRVSDIVVAAEALRSVLAPARSDAIGRSARALARSINASLRCMDGVLSCLFALRRRACNLYRAGRGRLCRGRVMGV